VRGAGLSWLHRLSVTELARSDRPQPFHLDIEDLEAAQALAVGGAANRLDDGATFWRTYADPGGHPLCLLPGKSLSNEEKPVV
jgi:hypothetical protein